MDRIGNEREAAEQQPADELDHEKCRVRYEREQQRTASSSEDCVDARQFTAPARAPYSTIWTPSGTASHSSEHHPAPASSSGQSGMAGWSAGCSDDRATGVDADWYR